MKPWTLTASLATAAVAVAVVTLTVPALAGQNRIRTTAVAPRTVSATVTPAAGGAVMRAPDSRLSRTGDDTTAETAVPTLRVTAVAGEGSVVTLDDGSMWQTYLENRPDVATWQPGDEVIVRLAPIAHGRRFTYELENARRDAIAVVAYRGQLAGN